MEGFRATSRPFSATNLIMPQTRSMLVCKSKCQSLALMRRTPQRLMCRNQKKGLRVHPSAPGSCWLNPTIVRWLVPPCFSCCVWLFAWSFILGGVDDIQCPQKVSRVDGKDVCRDIDVELAHFDCKSNHDV